MSSKTKTEIVSIPFVCAAGTDVGRQRDKNEDTFIFDPVNGFFLVVDGMGGHEKGEVAAKIAAEIVQTGIRKIENSAVVRLRDSIVLANNAVFAQALKTSSNMGCVLTALLIEDDLAVIGHVGDTRLYKIRKGKIDRLTTDHSYVGQLEEVGDLSEKRLMEHPRRNEVTRCVGIEEKSLDDEEFVDIFQTEFEHDAAFLLCSDGLSDLITAAQTIEIIESGIRSPERIISKLIEKANDAGGKDNITVVFVAGVDFFDEVSKRNSFSAFYEPRKIMSFFSNRWSLFICGTVIGAAVLLAYFYRQIIIDAIFSSL